MDSDTARTSDAIFATSCLLTVFYPAYLSAYHLRSRLSQSTLHPDPRSRSATSTPRSLPQDSTAPKLTIIDWFVLLRGVSLTEADSHKAPMSPIQALRGFNGLIPVPSEWTSTSDASLEFRTTMSSPKQPAAYRHPLYPILCATIPSAFAKLGGLLAPESLIHLRPINPHLDPDMPSSPSHPQVGHRTIHSLAVSARLSMRSSLSITGSSFRDI
jgi:hypothetical protein